MLHKIDFENGQFNMKNLKLQLVRAIKSSHCSSHT